jgi:hypothetical protein
MQPRTYSLVLSGGAMLLFCCVAAANLIFDPQLVFGTGLIGSIEGNWRYQHFRAYEADADRYDGLIFGSSRADAILLDDLSPGMQGAKFASFAVDLGQITDHLPVLEYVIKDKRAKRLQLKAVFLLIDLDFFGARPRTNETLHFMLPPAVSGESSARFWWKNLTAIQYQAWSGAVANAWRARGGRGADVAIEVGLRSSIASVTSPAAAAELVDTQDPQRTNEPVGLERITDRVEFKNQLKLLERFAKLCAENHVLLKVATSPLSRQEAVTFDAADMRHAADLVSQIVPLWNFADPVGLADDPTMWRDPNHFRPVVGKLMLDRIFGERLPADWRDFGEFRGQQFIGP